MFVHKSFINSTLKTPTISRPLALIAWMIAVIFTISGCGNGGDTQPPRDAPSISTQPESQAVTPGQYVTFRTVASGTGDLHYQWRKDGSVLGLDAPLLEIASVQSSDAGNYTVTVSNAVGSRLSDTATLTVARMSSPTLTTFTPSAGPVGTVVTLTGTNLTGTTAVIFNGINATTFTVSNATQITVQVPSHASTGTIGIVCLGGNAVSSAIFTVTSLTVPTITSFSPTSGPVGTLVFITGTNLSGITSLSFNGTSCANFHVISSTQITAEVPVGTTTGAIALATPTGTATSYSYFTVTAGGVWGPADTAFDVRIGTGADVSGKPLLDAPTSYGAKYVYCDPVNGNDTWTGTSGQLVGGSNGPVKSPNAGWALLSAGAGDWLMLANTATFRDGFGDVPDRSGVNAAHPTVITTYTPATWASHVGDRTGLIQFGWDGAHGPTKALLSPHPAMQFMVMENIYFFNHQNMSTGISEYNSHQVTILSIPKSESKMMLFYNVRFKGSPVGMQGDFQANAESISSGLFATGSNTITDVVVIAGDPATSGNGLATEGPNGGIPEDTKTLSVSGSTVVMSKAFTGLSGMHAFQTHTPAYFENDIVFRHCSFGYGTSSGSGHGQGLFMAATQNITIEDCVFHHNGWQGTDRDAVFVNEGSAPDVFKHNAYFATTTFDTVFRRNVSGYASLTGLQLRGGGVCTDNVFLSNPINVIVGKGDHYNVFRPFGVPYMVARNVVSGSAPVNSGLPAGKGINFGNTKSGPPVFDQGLLVSGGEAYHNLIANVGPQTISSYNIFPFEVQGDFPQPNSVNWHDNIQFGWHIHGENDTTLAGYWTGQLTANGAYYTVYRSNNLWDQENAGTQVINVLGATSHDTGNSIVSAGDFPDPTRSGITFAAAYGFASESAMLDAALDAPWQPWAQQIGDYIRAGFNR